MDIGMLWFDNDKKASIPVKVERAARYYQKKYGKDPDLCYVHPGMIQGENGRKKKQPRGKGAKSIKIGSIRVLKNEKILPDHFWIGISGGMDDLS